MNLLVGTFVPGSIAISGTSFTHDLVYDTPAADLTVLNKQKVLAMGASEAQAQALLANRWFSLSALTALVTDLERLGRIHGRRDVIALAATSRQGGGGPVPGLGRSPARPPARDRGAASIGGGAKHVIGITPGGAVVVPAPVDYLAWTAGRALRRAAGPPGGAARSVADRAGLG